MNIQIEVALMQLIESGSWSVEDQGTRFKISCGPVKIERKPAGKGFCVRVGEELFVDEEFSSRAARKAQALLDTKEGAVARASNDGREDRALAILLEMTGRVI